MKSFVLAFAAILAAAVVAAADKPEVSKQLQGRWIGIRVQTGDNIVEGNEAKVIGVTVEGNIATWRLGEATRKTKITFLGSSDNQRTMEIDFTDVDETSDDKGKVFEGIYEFRGETLHICLNPDESPKQRPVEFVAPEGSTWVAIALRREATTP